MCNGESAIWAAELLITAAAEFSTDIVNDIGGGNFNNCEYIPVIGNKDRRASGH
jgi:hypothetical protein